MEPAILFWLSFVAGMYAPVGSPCILVLYPGYISFLAGRPGGDRDSGSPLALGITVAAGVMCAMLCGGFVYTLILSAIGGEALKVLTVVLYSLLILFSFLLIFDVDYWRIRTPIPLPRLEQPLPSAFLLGIAFGIIILPCNAAAVAVLLALAASAPGLTTGLGSFISFGLGMTLPLIIIAGLSQARSRQVMEYLAAHRHIIRILSGITMLILSVIYLVFLFFPALFLA